MLGGMEYPWNASTFKLGTTFSIILRDYPPLFYVSRPEG